MNSVSRRSFLKTAGVATGAAAISASPAAAAAMQPDSIETTPTSKLADEAVIAIVRNASLGEVTVISGTTEKTYTDRVLVTRLTKAARQNHKRGSGGVA
jgi:TAT (twin-arginine translocation) pathway-exported protein